MTTERREPMDTGRSCAMPHGESDRAPDGRACGGDRERGRVTTSKRHDLNEWQIERSLLRSTAERAALRPALATTRMVERVEDPIRQAVRPLPAAVLVAGVSAPRAHGRLPRLL
jgi:hypothetical protein